MWKFKKLEEGEPERDPHEAEFFNVHDPSDSLVREVIQNSLDAKLCEEAKVTVRFTFGEDKDADHSKYYGVLIPHLESSGLLPREYSRGSPASFLTIEDFGTSGLDGIIERDEITENITSNYYNFWWCEGKSQKRGQKAGRWGLGKTAFHAASAFRSFWALTLRHDDRRELLLGKAILKTHRHHDGKKYNYYGYFAKDKYKPVEAKEILQDFRSRFAVTRDGEPGLSVVIPMPVNEINPDAIVRSVIIHYFFPIIKQMLVVEVNYKSSRVILDFANLCDTARKQNWEETPWRDRSIDSLMTFIEDVATTPPAEMISLNVPEGTPKMKEDLFSEKLDQARKLFSEDKLLWIKIPVNICPVGEPQARSFFQVFLQKDESLSKADEFYIRSGITISEITGLGNRRVRALLSAEDKLVSTFLGDCESPAHTNWKERTEARSMTDRTSSIAFKDKYVSAVSTLRFIKSSMHEIVKILDQPPPGLESDFLRDIFFVQESAEEKTGDDTQPDSLILPPPEPRILEVTKIQRGCRIALVDKEAALPIQATIKMAYAVRRGNPFSNYHPLDFDLDSDSINTSVTGGRIIECAENTMRVEVERSNFEIRVTGFDEHRDLVIDVREEKT